MDGGDFEGYMSREYQMSDDLFSQSLRPNSTASYHHHQHHHHRQGTGRGVDPTSPTLGGYSSMPLAPPRLQHSPGPPLNFDANPQQYYTGLGSIDGSTISGWSQSWQQQDVSPTSATTTGAAMMSSGSPTTEHNFLPILPELHQDYQYQYPHHHHHHDQYQQQQPQQHDLTLHPPPPHHHHQHQQEMRVPLSLDTCSTSTAEPVQQLQGGPGEECQVIPVSTHHQPRVQQQSLDSHLAEGHTTACDSLPSGCRVVSKVPDIGATPPTTADNQSVPNSEESSRSSLGSESSVASFDESSGDGVFSLTTSKVTKTQPSGQSHDSIYIPSLEVFPGDYGFKVTFKNPDSSAYTFSEDSKALCVNKNVDFAAIFSFSERPRAGFIVRTLVCPKTSQDIQKVGIVRRCVSHVHGDKGSNHFLVCRSDKAVYGECHSHSIISVPLDTMAEYDLDCPTCVYSCACYSTCVVGKGANRPTLVIIFSLIDNTKGSIVGQDIINLRCCACPNRDSGRARKRGSNTTSSANPAKKRRKSKKTRAESPQTAAPAATVDSSLLPPLSSLPAQLNRVKDAQPDEDGYYTFTWRMKDKSLFNMLTLMKEGHHSCL